MLCLYVCGHAFCTERVTSALSAELLTRNKALCLWACVCNEQVTSALSAELLTGNTALCVWARVCIERVTSALSAELLTRNKAPCLRACVCNERVTSALSAELLKKKKKKVVVGLFAYLFARTNPLTSALFRLLTWRFSALDLRLTAPPS